MIGKSVARQKLELVVKGFLKGESGQFRIIKGKITQYIYHQRKLDDLNRDEIISEVLEILYLNLKASKFRGDSISALNVYIYSIIRHRISRQTRLAERIVIDHDGLDLHQAEGVDHDQQVAAKELADKIFKAIDPKCRELLKLKFAEGWSDQEIADKIKKSKNATSTTISRCLKKTQELDIVKELL